MQHPSSCIGRKFVVSEGNPHAGLGSNVHVATSHVAFALHFNAIFLWARNAGELYTDLNTCWGLTNFECFFDPPSNCTLGDTLSEGAEVIYVKSENNPINGCNTKLEQCQLAACCQTQLVVNRQ